MCLLFSKLDFIGKEPSLMVNGGRMHKTIPGAILSLTTGLISLAASCYFIYLMFSRSSFSVLTTDEFNPKQFKDWTNQEFTMLVSDSNGQIFKNPEKIFNISAFYVKSFATNINQTISLGTSLTPIYMENCNISKNFQLNKDLWKVKPYTPQSLCIKRNQVLNATFPFGYTGFTSLFFYLHKCRNSTENSNC